jgi:hypothetical protein
MKIQLPMTLAINAMKPMYMMGLVRPSPSLV